MTVRRNRRGNIQNQNRSYDIAPPEEIIEQMQVDAGKGVSFDPSDAIWDGGDGPLSTDEAENILEKIFGAEQVLAQILMAIINSNPRGEVIGRRPKNKSKPQMRLEQAMKVLVGKSSGAGRPSKVANEQLEEIARRYWLAYAGLPEHDSTLRRITEGVVFPMGAPEGLSHEDIDSELQPYIRSFNSSKNELLTQISWAGLDEAELPNLKIAKILNLLAEFEILRRNPVD